MRRPANLRARRAGFTLLEVMIAVVILAVGLSSLFTSQAGAIRIAQRARTTAVATLLARCKMGELEEEIAKTGWPATSTDGRDGCCAGAEHDGYSCEWKVERIVLPEADVDQNNITDRLKDGTSGAAGSQAPGATAMPGATPGSPPGPQGTTNPMDPMNFGVPITGFSSMSGTGGGDPIASMVMEMAFPIMKPLIEEQVRRATVNVQWYEGSAAQNFEVVQFLVNELPALLQTVDEENEAGSTTPGTGTGTGTGTGKGTGTGTGSGAGGASTGAGGGTR